MNEIHSYLHSSLRVEMSLKLTLFSLFVLSLGTSCVGHDGHDEDQMPLGYVRYPYQATYPGDGSSQCFHHTLRNALRRIVLVTADAIFSGITTFARLPWVQCLTKEKHVPFDIAFLGAPFVSHTRALSCIRALAEVPLYIGH